MKLQTLSTTYSLPNVYSPSLIKLFSLPLEPLVVLFFRAQTRPRPSERSRRNRNPPAGSIRREEAPQQAFAAPERLRETAFRRRRPKTEDARMQR